MVREIEDARERMLSDLDVSDWDCHTCRSAVLTSSPSDPCPNCGGA